MQLAILPFKYLGSGRNRTTYLLPSGKYVLKIPRNEAGVFDNADEEALSLYKTHARCRTIKLFGTLCLVMEYVEQASLDKELPTWCDFVDCRQVGYNRKGKLLAYDYGRN